MKPPDFETLRSDLESLSVPEGDARHLRWLAGPLAVGRNQFGDYEIFIRGPELHVTSPVVQRHIQYDEWMPEDGDNVFAASRIALPPAPHFASIAALIGSELMRAGIGEPDRVQAAFVEVEPIIEMAIRRGALPENVVVGLLGELMLLRNILNARIGEPETLLRTLDYWQGWQVGGRDFRIGDHSIEVKTTRSVSSIHDFSGLHQLEPTVLPTGTFEKLHLMSIGLAPSTSIGETLPSVVGGIATLLSTSHGDELSDEFLRRVEHYGRQSGSSYSHETMRDWSAYATRFAHTFAPRLYRLDDPAMRLLKREVVVQTFVQPEGLSFTMHLPERVSAHNPAPNWEVELISMTVP